MGLKTIGVIRILRAANFRSGFLLVPGGYRDERLDREPPGGALT